MNLRNAAWHLDRLANSPLLEDDVRQAARMSAYLIRELDLRPDDVKLALKTIQEDTFK